jgi:hypothetical protein
MRFFALLRRKIGTTVTLSEGLWTPSESVAKGLTLENILMLISASR